MRRLIPITSLLFLSLTFAFPAYASRVQGNKSDYSSRSSIPLAFSSDNQVGDLIVVFVSGANDSSLTVSDTQTNTYTQLFKDTTTFGSTNTQIAWYAQGVKAGANTVTVSWTTAETSAMSTAEYNGVQITGSLDAGFGSHAVSTAWDSGNITTTHNHDTLIAFTACAMGITSTSAPFTQYQAMNSGGTTYGQISDDLDQPIGTYHASGGCTLGSWIAYVYGFIPPATTTQVGVFMVGP